MSNHLDLLEQQVPGSQAALNAWFDERFQHNQQAWQEQQPTSLTIMMTKGTLDWAYPAFILSSTASALGWKVTVFFTFYGLNLLKHHLDLKISPLGNPAMPMKMPFGPQWFQSIDWDMPNVLMAGIPGFESVATGLMKQTIDNNGVASIEELRQLCVDSEVNLVACQMTADLFGMTRQDFIPEISDWAGAATFLQGAQKSTICLYI